MHMYVGACMHVRRFVRRAERCDPVAAEAVVGATVNLFRRDAYFCFLLRGYLNSG